MVVASPPRKSRFRSQDASVDHVYLKSTWVVTSLRHPALRVLCCLAHTLVCLYVGVASPLLTSLKTPASFPVYGSIVRAFGTGFTWQKLIFQSVLSTSLLLLLRLVAYPRLVQRQWNWESSFHHATQTFSRLSRASASDGHGDAIQTATTDQRRVLALHTFTAGGASAAPAVRSKVWNVGASHGSWTFVAATFPFFWATAVYVIQKCVQGFDVEGMLFPEHYDDVWNSLQQLELQKHISTALVALSCIKLLVTLDWVLQDREFNRVFFGSWLLSVRRAYSDFPIVRIMGCWLSLVGVVVGGVCFGAISTLQADWARWNLDGANEHYTELWLSNMSWLALLGSLLVALDLLWVVQDFEFPSFASPLGSRMFGLPVEHFTLRFPLPFRMSFSSKWLGGFLVLALLVPLEISQVLQIVEYSPDKYEQYANSTTFQVIPLNSTHSHSLDETFNNIDEATRLMLEMGSLSRYFPWSAWDLSPALATLCLSVATLCWLWEKEACKMCFAVYLGLSDAQDERVKVFTKLNRKVPAATKHHLSSQQRLRILYKLRARSDSFCISLAALSVLTVWLQFRAIWRSSAKFHRDLPLQAPGETYAALLFLITLVLLHQVYYRYSLKMEIMVLRNQIPQECRHSIWQSPRLLLLPLLTEMILCGVFLPPLVHGRVHLDEERLALPRATLEVIPACPHPLTMKASHQACELQYAYPLEIVNMIVLVRLYWFARVIRNQLLKRVVAMTVSSRMLSGRDIPVDSLWWSFRVSFALRPSKVLITLFVVLWVSTAAAVSIFERPFPSKLEGEDHALWLTLVTMTGVGYGDAYPITTGGRIAIVLGAVFGGLAFMSLMTSEFLDSLKGTKREHAVLSAMDTMKWERTVRVFAAQLIQAAWGYHRLHNGEPNQRSKLSRRVAKAAHQFKRCRKRKPLQASNASHAFQTDELSGFVSNQVESWLVSTQAESNALLDSLEIQVDRIENSLQTLM